MAIVSGGARAEADGALSFGDFTAREKIKINDFEHAGNLYNVRTHKDVTRVEKNGKLLIEAVPGAAFFNLRERADATTFEADGFDSSQITLELEPGTEYIVTVDGALEGEAKSNMSGKITFSVDLGNGVKQVKVEKYNGES